jgi:hypothetical protein
MKFKIQWQKKKEIRRCGSREKWKRKKIDHQEHIDILFLIHLVPLEKSQRNDYNHILGDYQKRS